MQWGLFEKDQSIEEQRHKNICLLIPSHNLLLIILKFATLFHIYKKKNMVCLMFKITLNTLKVITHCFQLLLIKEKSNNNGNYSIKTFNNLEKCNFFDCADKNKQIFQKTFIRNQRAKVQACPITCCNTCKLCEDRRIYLCVEVSGMILPCIYMLL